MDETLLRDVQHLLRHLDNARRLRENRVVAGMFAGATTPAGEADALASVRALVVEAVQLLRTSGGKSRSARAKSRAASIIERCDLQGELHRVVCDDLGLSERQFYRARRKACVELGRMLASRRDEAHAALPASITLSEMFAWELNCAEGLRNLGQFDAARQRLQKLAAETSSFERVCAWCRVAMISWESGDLLRTREALGFAAEISLDALRPDQVRLASAEMQFVRASLAWDAGETEEAMTWNRRVLDNLRPYERLSERGVELAVLALLDLNARYCSLGETSEMRAAIAESRAVFARLVNPPPAIRSRFDMGIASVLTNLPGGLSEAEHELLNALEYSRRARFLPGIVNSTYMLGTVSFFRGDAAQATWYAHAAVTLAQTVSNNDDFFNSVVSAIRVDVMANRPAAAIAFTRQVRPHLKLGLVPATLLDLAEAEAFIKSGDPKRAAAVARAATQTFERTHTRRYLGAALQVLAEALVAIGEKQRAAEEIDAAIAVLERYGHPFSLARAYAYSAKLTGNVRHRRYGRELQATLQA